MNITTTKRKRKVKNALGKLEERIYTYYVVAVRINDVMNTKIFPFNIAGYALAKNYLNNLLIEKNKIHKKKSAESLIPIHRRYKNRIRGLMIMDSPMHSKTYCCIESNITVNGKQHKKRFYIKEKTPFKETFANAKYYLLNITGWNPKDPEIEKRLLFTEKEFLKYYKNFCKRHKQSTFIK